MRESSYGSARTIQATTKPRAELAKSLFGNILDVTPCPSIFCPDLVIPKLGKSTENIYFSGKPRKKFEIYIQHKPNIDT
jgi:hypothetical protein